MTGFYFWSLVKNFVILSLQYIETFVLSPYHQLNNDVSLYKLIFSTLSTLTRTFFYLPQSVKAFLLNSVKVFLIAHAHDILWPT